MPNLKHNSDLDDLNHLHRQLWDTFNELDGDPSKLYISKNTFNLLLTDRATQVNPYQVFADGRIGFGLFGADIFVIDNQKESFIWVM